MGNYSSKPLRPAPKAACILQSMLYFYLFTRGVDHLRRALKEALRKPKKEVQGPPRSPVSASAAAARGGTFGLKGHSSNQTESLTHLQRDIAIHSGAYLLDLLVAVVFRRGFLHGWSIPDILEHHGPAALLMALGPINDRLMSWRKDGILEKPQEKKRDEFQTTKWMRWWYIFALLSNGNEALSCLRSVAPKNRILKRSRFFMGLAIVLALYSAEIGVLFSYYRKALLDKSFDLEPAEGALAQAMVWGLYLHSRYLKGYMKVFARNRRYHLQVAAIAKEIAQTSHGEWIANGGM